MLAIELRSRRATVLLLPPLRGLAQLTGPRFLLRRALPVRSLQRIRRLFMRSSFPGLSSARMPGFVSSTLFCIFRLLSGFAREFIFLSLFLASPQRIAFLLSISAVRLIIFQLCAMIPVAAGAFLQRHAFEASKSARLDLPIARIRRRLLQHGRSLDRHPRRVSSVACSRASDSMRCFLFFRTTQGGLVPPVPTLPVRYAKRFQLQSG